MSEEKASRCSVGSIVIVLLVLLSGCTPKAEGGKIAVEYYHDERNADIYLMKPDGSELRPIVAGPAWDGMPALSPDGTRLAFASDRDGDAEIYVMNLEDATLTQLTRNEANDLMPAWSPRGNRIAFVSDRVYEVPGGDGSMEVQAGLELYIMNADGTGVQRLTGNPEDVSLYPSWSPDGSAIVYLNLAEEGRLYLVNVSPGLGEPVNLTPEALWIPWSPRWSPDGRYIVFMGDDGEKKDIYRMDVDGQNQYDLTANWPIPCGDPNWSPSGKYIVFVCDQAGPANAYVMTVDGQAIMAITHEKARLARPSWSR